MKKVITVAIAMLCVLGLVVAAGCQQATPSTEAKVSIGMSQGASQSTFCQGLQDGATQEITKLGGTPFVSLADNDPTRQASQIEDMVAKGCKGVICFAADTDAITASAKYCKDHGVAFVEASRLSPDLTNIDLAIGFSNKQQAELCGQAIVDGCKAAGFTEIKCIEFVGSLTDQNAIERQKYFEDFAKANNINIVQTVLTEWDAEKATARYKDAITACNDDYNSMYCASDFLFTPISAVLTERGQWVTVGKPGYKVIVGIDGGPDALPLIRDGYCYMTANTDVLKLGNAAADKIYDIITKGTKYTGDAKTIMIDATSITKANVDDATIWGNVYKAK
jgi:ribose transport system substrate-binding protein